MKKRVSFALALIMMTAPAMAEKLTAGVLSLLKSWSADCIT